MVRIKTDHGTAPEKVSRSRERMMTVLTRRTMLGGAATASAAAMMGEFTWMTSARAEAPQIGKQAPNFYRYKVGDFEVSVVSDGVIKLKLPPTFVANVPAD